MSGKIYIGDKEVGTVVASKIVWGPPTAGKTFDASAFGTISKMFTVTLGPQFRFGDVVTVKGHLTAMVVCPAGRTAWNCILLDPESGARYGFVWDGDEMEVIE